MAELAQIVGAHEPYEACLGEAAPQFFQRVGRIARAEPRLDAGDLDAGVVGDLGGKRHALGERRHAGLVLQRILRRDEPPDLVEIEEMERQEADMPMPAMSGVERAAEQPDPAPAPVGEAPRQREEAGRRGALLQGRT
jgi:hypothetical protein